MDQIDQAFFGAGQFWGVEEAFRSLRGVVKTTVGFMGGTVVNPTYEQVAAGDTSHAQVVQIDYNPAIIPFDDLLTKFWQMHMPTTTIDDQSSVRSVIFFTTTDQERLAQASRPTNASTQISPASKFYKAEEEHQKYILKRQLAMQEEEEEI